MAHQAATKGDLDYFERLIKEQDNTSHDDIQQPNTQSKPKRRLSTIISSIVRTSRWSAMTSNDDTDVAVNKGTLGFNEYGYCPIHAAAFHNHPAIIDLLVTKLKVTANQPTNNHHRALPLHLAIVTNSRGAVKTLLRNGANPWLRDGDGMDAFETAQRLRRRRCLLLLNQHVRKSETQCLGVVYGGACTRRNIDNWYGASAGNIVYIDCQDCHHNQSQGHHSYSQSNLNTSNRHQTCHIRKSLPYGPWDIECGRVLAEDMCQKDEPQLSDSDIDFPTTGTNTTSSLYAT